MATDLSPTDGSKPGRDGAKPAHERETPRLDGVLVVAKEPGPTSHDIVGLVRRQAVALAQESAHGFRGLAHIGALRHPQGQAAHGCGMAAEET